MFILSPNLENYYPRKYIVRLTINLEIYFSNSFPQIVLNDLQTILIFLSQNLGKTGIFLTGFRNLKVRSVIRIFNSIKIIIHRISSSYSRRKKIKINISGTKRIIYYVR